MKRLLTAIITVTFAHLTYASWLDITPVGTKDNTVYIRLNDVINPGDTERLKTLLQSKNAQPGKTILWMQMNSRGGDVSESYKIGRLLRSYKATVSHGYCASSCVFAYLGGSTRYYSSPQNKTSPGLWVHQPQATKELMEKFYTSPSAAAMINELKAYTIEMTGNDLFYNAMIRVPFDKPEILQYKHVVSMNVSTKTLEPKK